VVLLGELEAKVLFLVGKRSACSRMLVAVLAIVLVILCGRDKYALFLWLDCVGNGSSIINFLDEVVVHLVSFLFMQVFFVVLIELVSPALVIARWEILLAIFVVVFFFLDIFFLFAEKHLTLDVFA
jgi:hypothetical protein